MGIVFSMAFQRGNAYPGPVITRKKVASVEDRRQHVARACLARGCILPLNSASFPARSSRFPRLKVFLWLGLNLLSIRLPLSLCQLHVLGRVSVPIG